MSHKSPHAEGTGTCEEGPFEVRSSENSTRGPLSANFRSSQNSAADNDDEDEDDPAVGSLEPPVRKYGCSNYEMCLDLAAALNWASFTCGACRGTVNQSLLWRARHVARKDSIAKALCELPPVQSFEAAGPALKKGG